jgi:O-antigen ligase
MAALVLEFCWLFFSGGRATLLALAAGAALVLLLFGRRATRWVFVLAVAAGVGALLNLLLFEFVPSALDLGRDFFSGDFAARSSADVGTPRKYLWSLALDYVKESPLLGIGPMHYAARVNTEAAHPHNFYLQLAAEWGLPFATLTIGAAFLGTFKLARTARSLPEGEVADRALGMGLLAALCGIAADAMFSGNFVMPMSQLWIAFAAGLAIAYAQRASPPPLTAHANAVVRRGLVILLCAASLVAILRGTLPEVLDVNAQVEQTRKLVPNPVDTPRLWSHGWLR